ncbi:MAG: transglycosylase SLT domain-containing protein [Deltaproteobacteria bacterium]|nr:transglycosylase SLT domain-containing protein [Deltaproteobacteria bacterium]MBW2211853.1 transglycosylase SLT domain-containing protein [Deltaproteobacteria bacterium]MBW2628702.1 transglycosylase SLT domain-containing protein [Deltaproteobacteria bacterium]
MKRIWPFAMCIGLVVACHQQKNVRREVWPPPSEPQPVVAEAPAPPPKVLDPVIVELPEKSTVMQVRKQLDKDNPSRAREIADAALPSAGARDKGRLHWLAATAALDEGYSSIALGHLDTLGTFNHPLARWAKLKRASLLERKDPVTAAQIVASLTDDWAGRGRARSIETRTGDSNASGARLEIRLDGKPPAVANQQSVRPRMRQSLDKAAALYNAKRYREAERLFGKLIKHLKTGSVVWCKARYKQGRALLQDRERTRGAPVMRDVANKCSRLDADTRTWARYYAARAYGRIGQWDESVRQYEQLEAEAPAHSLADDSSYRAALSELENGKQKAALARLTSIPKRYPEGDMWPRALFKLGWIQLRDGKYDGAYDRFDELVTRGGDERQEGITGRANYWRARTLFMMGRRIDAVEAYEEIVRRWPLRYYAQQALWRLGEIVPQRVHAILQDMRAGNEPTRMVFAWRDEFDDPAFDRMIELLAVNEMTYASAEMSSLHMLGSGVDPEMAVVGAVLLQRAGAQTRLSRVIRAHFEDFEGLLPKGEGRLIWEATYPHAFSPLIEDIAGDEGIPPSFVRAIAREESSFDPEVVSWAKAYGLVQLIMPTAKRFASEVGERATPRTLKKPSVNLKIGARYMAWLWERLNENPALVPSAYNAGEGAVRRWLQEDAARPLDVFIEEIPYDETRRYTRRVLQTYGVYQWLDDEQLPELRAKLPATSGPQRFSALQ